MAPMSMFKAVAIVLIVAMYASGVRGQDFEMAPAPAPTMDKGAAAYSFGMSGPMICSSLMLSLLALLLNH
ncbi:hypothetical protein Tsubulata_006198 [Turnera subulata]|uniref:Uncharacterized protein n=1 Tax=Turnera subulata TaxID=218843 RepID=A0A9Q0FAN7_9ROSI|nr:hypothetical protein Tsubulata_006198 [Turnera subulata]